MEPFIGEIRVFGFNFAPNGWALCNGQLIPIAQNTALFSILGTTFGGNGVQHLTYRISRARSRLDGDKDQGSQIDLWGNPGDRMRSLFWPANCPGTPTLRIAPAATVIPQPR